MRGSRPNKSTCFSSSLEKRKNNVLAQYSGRRHSFFLTVKSTFLFYLDLQMIAIGVSKDFLNRTPAAQQLRDRMDK
jgi:hypothetical protein